MSAPSSVKKFQEEIKKRGVKRDIMFFVRIKAINADYFKREAKKAGISLSAYMDALFDSIRLD